MNITDKHSTYKHYLQVVHVFISGRNQRSSQRTLQQPFPPVGVKLVGRSKEGHHYDLSFSVTMWAKGQEEKGY